MGGLAGRVTGGGHRGPVHPNKPTGATRDGNLRLWAICRLLRRSKDPHLEGVLRGGRWRRDGRCSAKHCTVRWTRTALSYPPSTSRLWGLWAGFMAARIISGRPAHLAAVCRSSGARCDGTEQTVLLAIRASGEIHRIGLTTIAAVADTKAPQSVDDNRLSMGTAHLVDKLPGR